MPQFTAKEARELILYVQAPSNLRVKGSLNLAQTTIVGLPDGLETENLNLGGCTNLLELPAHLRARRLTLDGCTALENLPQGLSCYELEMRHTHITNLPTDLQVEFRLDLSDNPELIELPAGLKIGSLILQNCTALASLPEDLSVYFLDISGCTKLTEFPQSGTIQFGRLVARHCTSLIELPKWLTHLAVLDLRGCVSLTSLPEGLRVSSWLDLADTQITALPQSLQGVELRWRGIAVDERIVFHPETIIAQEILDERNAERRRVLLERMGYEAFMLETGATVLDEDSDPGGKRQLLRVELQNDEPLVCVAVSCPSTARQYVLRVPPTMRSCHQAAAWLAGFDNPDDYHPIIET